MKKRVMMVFHNSDISYVTGFSQILSKYFSHTTYLTESVQTKSALVLEAKKRSCKLIATTSFKVLKLIDPFLEGSLNDNLGTVLTFQGFDKEEYRIIRLPVLKTIYTMAEGRFLLDHYSRKLAQGGILKKDKFTWEFCTPRNLAEAKQELESGILCAVDIETSREDLKITSCAYTVLRKDYTTRTFVVQCSPEQYPFCLTAIAMLNKTSVAKVTQNGMYDAAYFLRFNLPMTNWLYDTYHMMHAIFAELPRSLSFISAFFLEDFVYWKDEAGNNLYEYNGKDTHNTLWTFLAQMVYIQSPEYSYAKANYLQTFPMVFPNLTCAMDGMEIDNTVRFQLLQAEQEKKSGAVARLNYLIGEEHYNPGSPKQTKELMQALGYTQGKGTDVKEMAKWKDFNPLYAPIVEGIQAYRKAAKAISTYFELTQLNGRLMYSLDPSGTGTGRTASASSAFWCGTQIQNIPPYARAMVKAEDGWEFVAVDKAQSESYCTAYLSQDLNLIKTLKDSPDFHCTNASAFFGIPFEELYCEATGTKLNTMIRDLAKRVNHGANYNMGSNVLLETMGVNNVIQAKALLGLPASMSLIQVCDYLLAQFDKTYPRIRGDWYKELTLEVLRTGKLHLPSVNYTRRTFLKPDANKSALNAVVAHKPQSLSVNLVNKAYKRVWRELQMDKYWGKFRLKAQIHDEILGIAKPEILQTVGKEIAEIMVIPLKIAGRTMTIPSTIATGKYWKDAHS